MTEKNIEVDISENKGVRSTLLTNQTFSVRSEMGSALDMGQIEGSNLLLAH